MRAQETLAASAVEAVLSRNSYRLGATTRGELTPFERLGAPAQGGAAEVPLNGQGDTVRFGLGELARPEYLAKCRLLAAPAAVDEAAPGRRDAPGCHDPTLGGHDSPSIRSGTDA